MSIHETMDKIHFRGNQSRRSFLQNSARAAMLISAADLTGLAKNNIEQEKQAMGKSGSDPANGPWYRHVTRWGQVNITEKDPPQYDIPWWRNYWKRTDTKGIVVMPGASWLIILHRSRFIKRQCI